MRRLAIAGVLLGCFVSPAFGQVSDEAKRPGITVEESGTSTNILVVDPDLRKQAQTLAAVRRIPASENETIVRWLSANARGLQPAFLFELSRRLWDMNEREQAMEWYAVALIRSMYDTRRCLDETAAGGVMGPMMLAQNVVSVILQQRDAFSGAARRAAARGDLFDSTVSPWWVCSHGIRAARAAIEGQAVGTSSWLKPESEWPAAQAAAISDIDMFLGVKIQK